MRVVVEIRQGMAAGRKLWLLAGQSIVIGRSQAADSVIADDPRLSSRHFQIECRADACWLRDLNSTNGTFVNGARVRETQLQNGDEIVAGQTTWAVSVNSEAEDALLRTPAETQPATAPAAEPERAKSAPDQAESSTSSLPNLVLEMVESTAAKRRIWLRPGQSASLGRAASCDYAFPDDPQMSGRHLSIETTGMGWRCRDLGSMNGTFVNEQLVAEAFLQRGDRVRVGTTLFTVAFSHGGISSRDSRASDSVSQPKVAARLVRPARAAELTYRKFDCASGLALCVSQAAEFSPSIVGRQLASQRTPLMICNVAAAMKHCPAASRWEATGREHLHSEEERCVLQPAASDDWPGMLDSMWGQDEVIAVWPMDKNDDPARMVEVIRLLTQLAAPVTGQSLVAATRPSVWGDRLANSLDGKVVSAARELALVLLEIHGGERWGIFGAPGIASALAAAGFRPAPPWA